MAKFLRRTAEPLQPAPKRDRLGGHEQWPKRRRIVHGPETNYADLSRPPLKGSLARPETVEVVVRPDSDWTVRWLVAGENTAAGKADETPSAVRKDKAHESFELRSAPDVVVTGDITPDSAAQCAVRARLKASPNASARAASYARRRIAFCQTDLSTCGEVPQKDRAGPPD